MTFLQPTKVDVQQAMTAVANDVIRKGEALKAFADSFEEMSEEEFEAYLGDQYSGASTVQQWTDEVTKATSARPNDTHQFHRALVQAFLRCQRENATEGAKVNADRAARDQAGL